MITVMFQKKGQRAIIGTEDGNRIDTMFVDRRNSFGYFETSQRNTLVRLN